MVTDIALNPDGFSVSPTDAFNLAPGASATFTVTFAPTTMGSDTDTLTFSTNDPMNLMVAIPLSGRGVDEVHVLSSDSLEFDYVLINTVSERGFRLDNTGTAAMVVTSRCRRHWTCSSLVTALKTSPPRR